LLLDLDPQQALARWWEIRRFKVEPMLAEMEGRESNPKLFTNVQNPKADVDVLKEKGWDWILIDTPPAMMEWIEIAVLAADLVIIPVRASPIDLESMDVAIEFCEAYGRPFAFVLTHYDTKWKLSKTAIPVLTDRGKLLTAKDGAPAALGYRQAYVGSMLIGRTGPEFSDKKQAADAKEEVDALWEESRNSPKTVRHPRCNHGRHQHPGSRRHRPQHPARLERAAAAPSLPRTVGGNTIRASQGGKAQSLGQRRQPKAKPEVSRPQHRRGPSHQAACPPGRAEFGMPMKQFVAKSVEHYWRVLGEQQSEAQNEEGQ
jgi:chromosome partitioning protein